MKDANAENIFQLDGKVPLGKAFLLDFSTFLPCSLQTSHQ